MIPPEMMRQIRRIEITASRQVKGAFAGGYRSVFKGRGLAFEEVREYRPGDDVRSIDWKVTARTGRPHIKRFSEERELTVFFLLDLSGSCRFGTAGRFKSQQAAEVCGLLAFAAFHSGDRVGLLAFSDRIETFVPPAKGSSHVLRIVRDALCLSPRGRRTDLALALEYLNRFSPRRAVAFVLSDFDAEGWEKPLSVTAKRHDLVAFVLSDPAEERMPEAGMIEIEDAETGRRTRIDTADRAWREAFRKRALDRRRARERVFRAHGVDRVELSTGSPCLGALIRFFRMREARARHG